MGQIGGLACRLDRRIRVSPLLTDLLLAKWRIRRRIG